MGSSLVCIVRIIIHCPSRSQQKCFLLICGTPTSLRLYLLPPSLSCSLWLLPYDWIKSDKTFSKQQASITADSFLYLQHELNTSNTVNNQQQQVGCCFHSFIYLADITILLYFKSFCECVWYSIKVTCLMFKQQKERAFLSLFFAVAPAMKNTFLGYIQ